MTLILSGMIPVAKFQIHLFDLLDDMPFNNDIFVNVNNKCGIVKERMKGDDIMNSILLVQDLRDI